jgi:hypothetical protein
MKISFSRGEKSITFDTPDDSIEETFGFLMFGLFGMGYDFEDINKHIISVSESLKEQTKKDHNDEPNQNSMSI